MKKFFEILLTLFLVAFLLFMFCVAPLLYRDASGNLRIHFEKPETVSEAVR